MLWKYIPVRSSEREGQQIGVWMKKFSAIAPLSCMRAFVFGMGPTLSCCGNDEPSIWSWSSVTNHLHQRVASRAAGPVLELDTSQLDHTIGKLKLSCGLQQLDYM